jgi:hypothetical protein
MNQVKLLFNWSEHQFIKLDFRKFIELSFKESLLLLRIF